MNIQEINEKILKQKQLESEQKLVRIEFPVVVKLKNGIYQVLNIDSGKFYDKFTRVEVVMNYEIIERYYYLEGVDQDEYLPPVLYMIQEKFEGN